MPGSSGSLLLLERGKASVMLLNANANGVTCLPQVQGHDVCFARSPRLRSLSRA